MAKKTGYVEYTCDRCGRREYLAEGAVTVNRWYAVSRYDAEAVQKSMTLCASCYAEYQQLMGTQDGEYNAYMKNNDVKAGE